MLLPLAPCSGAPAGGSPPWRSRRSRSRARCTSRSARSRSCSPTRSRGAGSWHGAIAAAAGWRPGRSSGGSHSATRSSVPTPRSSATRHGERLPLPRPGRVRAVRLPRLAAAAPRRAGLGCLCFRNTISSGRGLALVLGLGALVPALLALGSNQPGYGVIWRHTPLHATRVPERLPPIACLCLAALAGVAIACVSETQPARGSSPRSPRSPSPPTCGCRSTTRSSPTRGTRSTPASPRRRRGGCSSCRRSRRTRTPAACTSTTRCRRQGAAARLCHLGAPEAYRTARQLPERARELGVRVVVAYRNGVPEQARSSPER